MKLVANPIDIDLFLKVVFEKPKFEQMRDEGFFGIVQNLVEIFSLRIDDIKVNREALSGGAFNFSKFYGNAFLSVHIGFEEATASLRNPQDESLVDDIVKGAAKIISDESFIQLTINNRTHYTVESGLESFLDPLSPPIPDGFKESLIGGISSYTLQDEKDSLTTSITVGTSLFARSGLYVGFDFNFNPCRFNLVDAIELYRKKYEWASDILNLHFQERE